MIADKLGVKIRKGFVLLDCTLGKLFQALGTFLCLCKPILRIEYPEAFSFIYEPDDHYSLTKEFLPSVMFVAFLP